MFYVVKASVANLFDKSGNAIERKSLKFRDVELTVYSREKSEALMKAGRNISAQEMTHNKLELA